jgi:predicted HTH transcriptional regulator
MEWYNELLGLCKNKFDERHGKNHDKYIWSSRAFNYLITNVLNIDLFYYDGCSLKWIDPRGETQIFRDTTSCIDTLVYITEHNVLYPIYQSIQKSKYPLIAKRTTILNALCHVQLDDIEYMSAFVELVLKRRPLKNLDYKAFKSFIHSHAAYIEQKKLVGQIMDVAIMSCIIS